MAVKCKWQWDSEGRSCLRQPMTRDIAAAWYCATFHHCMHSCPGNDGHTADTVHYWLAGQLWRGRWWKTYRLSALIVHASASEPTRPRPFICDTVLTYCRHRLTADSCIQQIPALIYEKWPIYITFDRFNGLFDNTDFIIHFVLRRTT